MTVEKNERKIDKCDTKFILQQEFLLNRHRQWHIPKNKRLGR